MTGRDSDALLSRLEVLVVDCQATAAAAKGHLLEIGWARTHETMMDVRTRLIRLPAGVQIPPAVKRVTGISDAMTRDGVDAGAAWLELSSDAAGMRRQPPPTAIHFAPFELPFLRSLAGDRLHLEVVCTHDIACRLLPGLPRRSLRALAGYFGGAVGTLRRSADHVRATAFVWQKLVELLEAEGVSTWSALREWLARPARASRRSRRVWPMPRDARLALPDAPGVYRLLRTSGDVIYVGKASSLHDRVNGYFRQQHGVPERMLEMLSQVRAISFEVTPTALEAALYEPVEIKRHRPPYNIALVDDDDRRLWFAPPDLSERSPRPSPRCCVGPFPSHETLDRCAALGRLDRGALAHGRWSPDAAVFDAGYERFTRSHPELSDDAIGRHRRLLALGTRLWREGRRDRRTDGDEANAPPSPVVWTPDLVQRALETIALRAALARRRAIWLTRLVDATVVWREPDSADVRLLVVHNGDISVDAASEPTPPVPCGYARPDTARHRRLDVARFDRLRILTTELKRLSGAGAFVALRFGSGPALAGARLASALRWV